jgi:hypothetical protein
MKPKSLLAALALACGIIITGISAGTSEGNGRQFQMQKNPNAPADSPAVLASITVRDFAFLLIEANEHYPLSDMFIETHRQAAGGYIAFAARTGHLIDKAKREPNQKWRFPQSWMLQSMKDGTLNLEDSANTRIYAKLLCPELLLWIYEACGVNSENVSNAYEAAARGKKAGTTTAAIAKSMRTCVSWDDIVAGLQKSPGITEWRNLVSRVFLRANPKIANKDLRRLL